MNQKVENLSKESLKKTFRRLRKVTKGFKALIVRDPLDFLDFEVDLDSNLGIITYEVNSGNYHPQRPYLHPSAKSKGINRPTVVFDVKDALIYRFCIEQIEDELLEKTRQKKIRGGIKITANKNADGDDYYEKWFDDWMEHNEDLRNSLLHKQHLVSTDIASYFENINILILRDMVRSDVEGKLCILNLLFYFLENTRFRNLYEVNTYNGLPQEDIDCSRILAYYFLKSHDEEMGKFCRANNAAEFYRFVDDMSITVDSEVMGKKALKILTESLRRLNLVSSIEKTSIISSSEAQSQLFFRENRYLSGIEERLLASLREGSSLEKHIQLVEGYYNKLVLDNKEGYKNWIKILKRFYTLCTYAGSSFLLSKIPDHIIKYPDITDKLGKYLLRNRKNVYFKETLIALINYLYSEENLYPAVESSLIETFLMLDPDDLDSEIKCMLKKLGNDLFFSKPGYSPLSDYARALACLIFYRYDKENLGKIVKHYLKASEDDYLLKKYMILVCLTVKNADSRRKVLDKAKTERNQSISRLVNLVQSIDNYKNMKEIRNFLREKRIYIYYDPNYKFEITEEYNPIRSEILEELISIYSTES